MVGCDFGYYCDWIMEFDDLFDCCCCGFCFVVFDFVVLVGFYGLCYFVYVVLGVDFGCVGGGYGVGVVYVVRLDWFGF